MTSIAPNRPWARPSVADVHDFLRSRNRLIVHFSGTPPGHGKKREDHMFPADLLHVLSGRAMGGLSASIVQPGDRFSAYGLSNATGFVGVILDLQTDQSLLNVDAGDCGSEEYADGSRTSRAADLSLQDLSDSMCNRTEYNEWVVDTYKVLGIFAAPDYEVWAQAPVLGNPEGADILIAQSIPKSSDELRTLFAGWNIYSFDDASKGIVRWTASGHEPVEHSAIYKV